MPEDEVMFDLTVQQIRIFVALKRAGSAGIEMERLVDFVYYEQDGGPLTATPWVKIQITDMNKTLAKHGLRIARKRAKIWRLELVDAAKSSLVRVK